MKGVLYFDGACLPRNPYYTSLSALVRKEKDGE